MTWPDLLSGWKRIYAQSLHYSNQALFMKVMMIQGSAHLTNVGAGPSTHKMLYSTPFFWFPGIGFLGCTSSCQVIMKGWLDGTGMDG